MRVLVTGSRDWDDPNAVYSALEEAFALCRTVFVVVHGDCPTGADKYADNWALEKFSEGYFVKIERHPADWKGPRKRGAGFARNAEMVALGADLCLAFILDGSNGATHCSGLAEKAGIETRYFRRETKMQRPKRVNEEIKIEDARLIWRNFGGEKRLFNENGKRNFSVVLDDDVAEQLIKIGWNVKRREMEDGSGFYHLPVTVKMDGKRPPKLFLITKSKNRRTPLDEETVMLLDYAEFDAVDLIIRPFNWGPIQGKFGVSAYLKTGFFIIREDELELKYQDVPMDDEPLAIENVIDVEGEWVDDEEIDEKEELEYYESRAALPRGNG